MCIRDRSWDVIEPKQDIDESMTSFTSQLKIGEKISSQIKLFQLMQNEYRRDRQLISLTYQGDAIKTASISFNQVRSEIDFRELDAQIFLMKGSINPFITYAHEMREKGYSFDDILFGMNYSRNSWLYSLGLGTRSDYMASTENTNILEQTKSGKYVKVDIKNVQSSCGCTIPKKPEDPIDPGEKGEILVRYDTNRIGVFNKSIIVTSNANSDPIITLRITGIVGVKGK